MVIITITLIIGLVIDEHLPGTLRAAWVRGYPGRG